MLDFDVEVSRAFRIHLGFVYLLRCTFGHAIWE